MTMSTGSARKLGADPADQVPFAKYAKAAESLLKPSSAACAVAAGAPFIERVDLLVKLISHQLGKPSAEIDRTVETVDQKLEREDRRGRFGRAVRRVWEIGRGDGSPRPSPPCGYAQSRDWGPS